MGLSCWLGWSDLNNLLKTDIPLGPFFLSRAISKWIYLTLKRLKYAILKFRTVISLFALLPFVSLLGTIILWSLLLSLFPTFISTLSFPLFICMSSSDRLPSPAPQSAVFKRCHQRPPEMLQNVRVLFCCPSSGYWEGWNPSWVHLANVKILVWRRSHLFLPVQALQAPTTSSVLVWWLVITHTLSDVIYLLLGNAPSIPIAPVHQG